MPRLSMCVGRDAAESLVRRAEFLPAAEQRLIELVFDRQVPLKDLAQMQGVTHRSMTRRVRRLVERMSRPRFSYVCQFSHKLSGVRRQVATLGVLHGLPQRRVAAQLGLSLHHVGMHLRCIEAQTQLIFESPQ